MTVRMEPAMHRSLIAVGDIQETEAKKMKRRNAVPKHDFWSVILQPRVRFCSSILRGQEKQAQCTNQNILQTWNKKL